MSKTPPDRYACHNRPAQPANYVAPDGFDDCRDGFNRPCPVQRYVEVAHVTSTDCKYSQSTRDPKCEGCNWDNKGEPREI